LIWNSEVFMMKAERRIRRWTGVSTIFSKVRGLRLVKFAPTVY